MMFEMVFGLRHKDSHKLVRLDIAAEDQYELGAVVVQTLSLSGEHPFEVASAMEAARAVVGLSYSRESNITPDTVEVVRLSRTVTIESADEPIPLRVKLKSIRDARHDGQLAVAMLVENRAGLEPGVLVAGDMTVRRILEVRDTQDGMVTLICTGAL